MKRWKLGACLILALLLLPWGAWAQDSLSLTVLIEVEGPLPAPWPQQFTVEMAAREAGAPMPPGSQDRVYRVSRMGTGTLSLGPLTPTGPGRWSYRVRQIPAGTDCQYDLREYIWSVAAYWGTQGGLEVAAILRQDGAEEKLSGITWINRAVLQPEPSPGPTGGGETPGPTGGGETPGPTGGRVTPTPSGRRPTPTPSARRTTPAPSGGRGGLTATGVEDLWPYYLGGAALLLGIGLWLFFLLRRKEDDP